MAQEYLKKSPLILCIMTLAREICGLLIPLWNAKDVFCTKFFLPSIAFKNSLSSKKMTRFCTLIKAIASFGRGHFTIIECEKHHLPWETKKKTEALKANSKKIVRCLTQKFFIFFFSSVSKSTVECPPLLSKARKCLKFEKVSSVKYALFYKRASWQG